MNKAIKKAIIILVIIFAIIGGFSATLSALNRPMDKDSTESVNVTIAEGSSTHDIATTLYDGGLIRSVRNYKILSKIWRYDGQYKAGTYLVSPGMKCSEIADVIVSGQENTNSFTIPEGYTIDQVASVLDDAGLADEKTFLEIAHDNNNFTEYEFLEDAQSGDNRLEGYLFPSTYQVSLEADEKEIIETMLSQYDSVFTDEYKARAKELGYSENEIIIIASIIEREAQQDEDRAKIASVIYNRLDDGMNLQMCSTVQYILGEVKPVLSIADTQIESPYNTYINEGLPKGPICSPGQASIEAALYPEDTDYIFFVVSEKLDGSHNFSDNEEQFQKDSEAYQKALEEQEESNS